MRIVALIAVYNEEHAIARVIEHLLSQGIRSYILDNDSTDETRMIVEHYLNRGVVGIERLPRNGVFELEAQLRRKEQLCREIEADWFIHHDADEIREAPFPYRNLAAGLATADQAGYNAVDFDEFVFLPTSESDDYRGRDFVAEMQYYCFLRPRDGSALRINAWKNTGAAIDLISSGGHQVEFSGRHVSPERFVMRHYIALSHAMAVEKYCRRDYSVEEFDAKGWHGARAIVRPTELRLPTAAELCKLEAGRWDRSNPQEKLPLFGASEDRAETLRRRRNRHVGGAAGLWNAIARKLTGRGHRLRRPPDVDSPSATDPTGP